MSLPMDASSDSHATLVNRIAFSLLRGINCAIAAELLARVGSENTFFATPRRTLAALMGFDSKLFDDTMRSDALERARREADFVVSSGIRAVYFTDADYPVRLSHCDDAPLMIYTLGRADLNGGHFISIVGTRHATPYGIDFVSRTVAELAECVAAPVTVVSGLAFGIDVSAHKAALKEGLPTASVLAHGLNMIYPAQHRSVAAEIVGAGGALITEYPSGTAIHKGNFLARNRIIAGLCDCVLVAESAAKGGALVTANLASEYSRDVFALPGRTSDMYSAGCNRLIASCVAGLVTSASDIITAMGWEEKPDKPVQGVLFEDLTPHEQAVVDYLTAHGEARLPQFQANIPLSVGRIMAMLIDLEFRHVILSYPGGIYRLA